MICYDKFRFSNVVMNYLLVWIVALTIVFNGNNKYEMCSTLVYVSLVSNKYTFIRTVHFIANYTDNEI